MKNNLVSKIAAYTMVALSLQGCTYSVETGTLLKKSLYFSDYYNSNFYVYTFRDHNQIIKDVIIQQTPGSSEYLFDNVKIGDFLNVEKKRFLFVIPLDVKVTR